MKVSYRDQVILIVVIVIVLLGCGFMFIIWPQIKQSQAKQAEFVQVQEQKDTIQAKIDTGATLAQQIQDLYTENRALQEFFLPEMTTYQTDQYISEYIVKNHLKFNALSIQNMAVEDMTPYSYEFEEVEYPLQDAANLDNVQVNQDEANYQAEESSVAVAVSSVNFAFTGTLENVYKFVDEINGLDRSVRVISCTISDIGAEPGQEVTGDMTIKMYSLAELQKPKV